MDIRTYKPFCRGDDSIVAAGFFPSEHSARWWLRRHRAEAVAAGVVVRLRGQDMADPQALGSFMVDVGRREAQATNGLPMAMEPTSSSALAAARTARCGGRVANVGARSLRMEASPISRKERK